MKPEQSTVARSFRAVFLAVVLVALVALSTMAYSVYADYNGAIGIVGQQQAGSGVSTKTVVQGTTTTVYLNVTIPNKGLYELDVSLACLSNTSSDVACTDASVSISPGGEQTLHFAMSMQNPHVPGPVLEEVKGNLTLAMVPFASLSIVVDLSSLAGVGG